MIRAPSTTCAGSSGCPLSVTERTVGAIRSIQLDRPGSRHPKVTRVVLLKVSPAPLRSRSTS